MSLYYSSRYARINVSIYILGGIYMKYTKTKAAVLAAVLTAAQVMPAHMLYTAAVDQQSFCYADMDGNGRLNAADLTLMKRGFAKPFTLVPCRKRCSTPVPTGKWMRKTSSCCGIISSQRSTHFRQGHSMSRKRPTTDRKRSQPDGLSKNSTAAPMQSMRAEACS